MKKSAILIVSLLILSGCSADSLQDQASEPTWLKEDRTVDCLVGSENESYYSSILE